jgi:hypothetical protein
MHLSTTAFLSTFDRLCRAADTIPGQTRWVAHGLAWSRDRHAYYSGDYSVTIEVVRVSSPGPKGWTLMVVREGWWAEDGREPIKTREWAHLNKGDRTKALSAFNRLFDELQSPVNAT